MKTLLLLLFLICICGCSPQKDLANKVKDADRAVFATTLKGYEEAKTTVTGDDLKQVIQAIANGRKLSKNVEAALDFQIIFYRGSEQLATVNTSSGLVFWANGPYEDTTKTLEKFCLQARGITTNSIR